MYIYIYIPNQHDHCFQWKEIHKLEDELISLKQLAERYPTGKCRENFIPKIFEGIGYWVQGGLYIYTYIYIYLLYYMCVIVHDMLDLQCDIYIYVYKISLA